MFVSVRRKFRKGDAGWLKYIKFANLPHLSEVRSIDAQLNRYLPDDGDIDCTLETLDEDVNFLLSPDPNDRDEYYCMLAIDLLHDSVPRVPDGWKLLGYDLSDKTETSSLLNCGPWEGQLEPLVHRLNEFGLLSLADAELARKLLPIEWGEQEHHAHVQIWAVYEREYVDKSPMFLRVRTKFREGDKGWREHIEHYRVSYLSEIRSIDPLLNHDAPRSRPAKCTPETVDQALAELPIPNPNDQYYLLAIDLLAKPEYAARVPDGWKLMGYDVSDDNGRSSLHRVGRWEGQLEPLNQRLNEFGLLSLADAELARKLLPLQWGEQNPHAHVTIWALYERE